MALNGNAMLTLAQAKSFLSIPTSDADYDDEVTDLVNMLSDLFCRYCNRDTFVSSAVIEYTQGKDDDTLWLRNPPIVETASSVIIWMDSDRLYPDSTRLTRTDYAVDSTTGKVTFVDDYFISNILSLKISYMGGYSTLPGDLLWAAKLAAKFFWSMKERVGVSSVSQAQGGSTSYSDLDAESGLPVSITAILKKYRRWSS